MHLNNEKILYVPFISLRAPKRDDDLNVLAHPRCSFYFLGVAAITQK